MNNLVIIKGNKYGISIVLDSNAEFSDILDELRKRLEMAKKFFDSNRQMAVAFENRKLSNDELDKLLTVIKNESKLNIQYVLDENSDLEKTFHDISVSRINETTINTNNAPSMEQNNNYTVSTAENSEHLTDSHNNYDPSTGMFFKGTLRSGQTLESDNSIVIIGDVNPGASVIAGGNIVIIGSLTGSVQAGARGNRNCFVMALSMAPIQIQIADIIARSSDKKSIDKKSFERLFNKKNSEKKSNSSEAMIATVIDDHIYVDNISKSAISDIII